MLTTLVNIGNILLFLNLVLFVKCFSKEGKAFSIFTFYLALMFLIQVSSDMMTKFRINNLYLSHFYFIGQFLVLGLFYGTIFKTQKLKKYILTMGIIGLTIILLQYIFDPSQFFKFNLFEISVTSLLVLIFAVIHLYNMLTEKKEFYYINWGIIIYLFGSTILFICGNLIVTLNREFTKLPWILNAFLYIIYQLFITFEWYKNFSKSKIQ
tara:strand:+ start:262 stop:891 length:630 start_codon:yes stop_codon:yes gene_type:complete